MFAIGDCGGFLESTGKPTLPALAQVSGFCTTFPCAVHVFLMLGCASSAQVTTTIKDIKLDLESDILLLVL